MVRVMVRVRVRVRVRVELGFRVEYSPYHSAWTQVSSPLTFSEIKDTELSEWFRIRIRVRVKVRVKVSDRRQYRAQQPPRYPETYLCTS